MYPTFLFYNELLAPLDFLPTISDPVSWEIVPGERAEIFHAHHHQSITIGGNVPAATSLRRTQYCFFEALRRLRHAPHSPMTACPGEALAAEEAASSAVEESAVPGGFVGWQAAALAEALASGDCFLTSKTGSPAHSVK